MSKTRFLAMCRLLVIAAFVLLVPSMQADGQRIIAHRGASFEAPENTLSAFRLAWRRGADGVEGDFYLTRDGHIVTIHDGTTKRTAGVDLRVADSTLEKLRKLDVGAWKDSRYRGERIPTLAEVLATVPAGKQIFIEIKCGSEIVPRLVAALKASHLSTRQTVVIAFDEQVIRTVKERMPNLTALWLVGYKQDKATGRWSPTRETVLATLKRIHADGLDSQANRAVVDKPFVESLRAAGMQFHVWTIDDPAEARHFQRLGVESITTNRPVFIRQGLKR